MSRLHRRRQIVVTLMREPLWNTMPRPNNWNSQSKLTPHNGISNRLGQNCHRVFNMYTYYIYITLLCAIVFVFGLVSRAARHSHSVRYYYIMSIRVSSSYLQLNVIPSDQITRHNLKCTLWCVFRPYRYDIKYIV